MEDIKNYLEQNHERILSELFGLIRTPSISSEVLHKDEMLRAADYWKSSLLIAGADRADIYPNSKFKI